VVDRRNSRCPSSLGIYMCMSVYIHMYVHVNEIHIRSRYAPRHSWRKNKKKSTKLTRPKLSLYTCMNISVYIYLCMFAYIQYFCTWSFIKEGDPHGRSTKCTRPKFSRYIHVYVSIYIYACTCNYNLYSQPLCTWSFMKKNKSTKLTRPKFSLYIHVYASIHIYVHAHVNKICVYLVVYKKGWVPWKIYEVHAA